MCLRARVPVGTNLPVSALTPAIEKRRGKPLIGVNVATYWLALRRLGIGDRLPGMGLLAEKCLAQNGGAHWAGSPRHSRAGGGAGAAA